MKVFITEPAKAALKGICEYYKKEGYADYAIKLRQAVITKIKSLSANHERGQEEEMLRPLQKNYRYLLAEQHYKRALQNLIFSNANHNLIGQVCQIDSKRESKY